MQSDSERARSFWVTAPGVGEIRHHVLPPPMAGGLRLRTLYTGISRGSEALVFQGRVPSSQYQTMRAPFQEGEFPAPVKYGYSNVARVETGPEELVGQVVFSLFPHQDRFHLLPAQVHVLPQGLPPERAVLAANMETAVNGLWDAMPALGERVVVVGAGVVGLLQAWLCSRIPGVEVVVVDVQPQRQAVADTLGVPFALPDGAAPEADLVIHASGHPSGLQQALALAGTEGRIIEMSWYGDRHVSVPLGEAFHHRRLQLRSSQVGRLPASQLARWDARRRMALALSLLRSPELDALITGESAFEELPALMPDLASGPGATLCHRLRFDAVDD